LNALRHKKTYEQKLETQGLHAVKRRSSHRFSSSSALPIYALTINDLTR
jgi:hypothetical protein